MKLYQLLPIINDDQRIFIDCTNTEKAVEIASVAKLKELETVEAGKLFIMDVADVGVVQHRRHHYSMIYITLLGDIQFFMDSLE